MGYERGSKLIWLIDRRDYWRDRCTRALADAGFRVQSFGHYDFPPEESVRMPGQPALVILGCAEVGAPEWRLVEEVRARGDRLVVLASSVSAAVMRYLFLAGAEDVAEMPGRADQLVELVAERLDPAPESYAFEAHLHARG
jgi:DNA-binding NtrC family response regulator